MCYLEIYRTAQNNKDHFEKTWLALKEITYLQVILMLFRRLIEANVLQRNHKEMELWKIPEMRYEISDYKFLLSILNAFTVVISEEVYTRGLSRQMMPRARASWLL